MSVKTSVSSTDNAKESSESADIMTWEEYRAHYVARQKLLYEKQREAKLNAGNNMQTATAATTTAASASHGEQQQQQQRPAAAEFNFWDRIEPHQALIARCADIFWRAIVATLLFFRTVTVYYVLLTIGIYFVWLALSYILTSVHIERERVNNVRGVPHSAPPVVHRRRSVFVAHKTLYVITRCITSFFLSLSPTYSIEQLEAELAEDGIVMAHQHQD